MEKNDPAPLRISINDGEPDVHIIKDPKSHELEPFMKTKTPKEKLIKLFMNTNHRFFSGFVGDDLSRYKLYQHMLIALALGIREIALARQADMADFTFVGEREQIAMDLFARQ